MNIEKTIQKIKAKELSYWEEAEVFKKMLKTGINQSGLAKKLGLKQTTISNKIRLLKLCPEVRDAIAKSDFAERYARALLKVSDHKMQLRMIKHIEQYDLTVHDAEEYIEKQLRPRINPGNLNEFIQMIANSVRSLKTQGINIKSGKREKEGYTDIVVRIFK
jgi:ParB family chromosome partitioning protein